MGVPVSRTRHLLQEHVRQIDDEIAAGTDRQTHQRTQVGTARQVEGLAPCPTTSRGPRLGHGPLPDRGAIEPDQAAEVGMRPS